MLPVNINETKKSIYRPLHLGVSSGSDSIGGLNRFAREIIGAQRSLGIEASLLAISSSHNEFEFTVEYSESRNWMVNIRKRNVLIRNLLNKYDLLDIHFALSAWPFIDRKVPKIFHFHGPWHLESQSNGNSALNVKIKKLVELNVMRDVSHFICLSKSFANLLNRTYGIAPSKVEVIPPGINKPNLELTEEVELAFRRKYKLESDPNIIICVRRIVPRMGLDILVDAIAKVPHAVKLLIIGDGFQRKQLQDFIERRNLSNRIILTGFIPEQELQIAYSIASVSVVPSLHLEGFGLSALEAMAYGTPVIATKIDGLNELMSDLPNEFRVESGSVDALALAISNFFSHQQDFAELFRDHSKKYDWKTAVELTNDCYERAMSQV